MDDVGVRQRGRAEHAHPRCAQGLLRGGAMTWTSPPAGCAEGPTAPAGSGRWARRRRVRPAGAQRRTPRPLVVVDAGEAVPAVDDAVEHAGCDEPPPSVTVDAVRAATRRWRWWRDGRVATASDVRRVTRWSPFDRVVAATWSRSTPTLRPGCRGERCARQGRTSLTACSKHSGGSRASLCGGRGGRGRRSSRRRWRRRRRRPTSRRSRGRARSSRTSR